MDYSIITSIIYIVINLSLLFIFIVGGINISRGFSYWKNAVFCSIVFVLIVGSRYARGYDYLHYAAVYANGEGQEQIVFWAFNYFMKNVLGVSKYYIFYFYAVPFVLSGFRFLENFRRYSKYTFPFFLMALIYFEECFIRQAFGFSFIFLFLDVFIRKEIKVKRKILLCSILTILILFTHSANILFIFVFVVMYLTLKKVINYKYSILFCSFVHISLLSFMIYRT